MQMVFYPILAPQNGRCIRYTWFSIPSWHPKTAGVSDTLGFVIPSWPPKWQVYQIHLVFYPILAPQDGRRIRYTLLFYPILAHQNSRYIRCKWFSIPSWHPKMAGVSDTLGFLSHLGTPRRQVYQIHLVLLSHLGFPKWQVYQIHLVFYPIFAPQDGRRIRYTCFSTPSWHPKMAGVSDAHGFLSHLGTPKWQLYQIHLVFYPILAPQNGRPPNMATVSDTVGVKVFLKMSCVNGSWYYQMLRLPQKATIQHPKGDTPASPNIAPAPKCDIPTSPDVAPATKSDAATSPKCCACHEQVDYDFNTIRMKRHLQ